MSDSAISPIRREFLGWDRPALPTAAERLAAGYRQGQVLDLSSLIVVMPGQRAGRRLRELLVFLAEDQRLRLTPPQVVTEGALPEMLYTPKQPFADDIVQDLAWAQALRYLPSEQRRYVVPNPPADGDTLRWQELGDVFRRLHTELAADGLDFEDARSAGPQLPNFVETDRWDALANLQQHYLRLLDRQSMWDKQTARLKAIEFGEITSDRDIVLLGAVDLNRTLRQMLDMVAGRVTAYVVAPAELADRFDAHGCLIPAAWGDAVIPLRDEQLQQVDGPVDQADAVTSWLVDLGGRFRNDQLAIGVADEALVPQLQRQLEQCGVHGRWAEGVRFTESAPYRLLVAAVQYAAGHGYRELAALLRHPDVEEWLLTSPAAAKSLPAQLDLFYNRRLPRHVRAGAMLPSDEDWPDLGPAIERIEAWLKETSASHPLREWSGHFRKILGTIYGGRDLEMNKPADEVLHRSIGLILRQCDILAALPESLDPVNVRGEDALQIALGPVRKQFLPPPADPEAVEILGWLELPLDDSHALVVTSFNDGYVPQSTGVDAFLPDRLRHELHLEHSERRYARDAYATSVLCHAREDLRLIFARRNTNNDPMFPSRLIFACADDAMVRRAGQFTGQQEVPTVRRRPPLSADGSILPKSKFKVPLPIATGAKPDRIAVTRFKAYLACPYRYYLRHVRKLEAVTDAAEEMDGSAFGTLLHGALSALGHNAAAPRQGAREEELFEFLNERLHAVAKEKYGAEGQRAVIRLQLAQARARLKAFAAKQTELMRGGWRIVYTETSDKNRDGLSAPFAVDDGSINLVGSIDRIDYHDDTRVLRILDYKTGDKAQKPNKTHHDGEQWIDLQLPLYRHLVTDVRLQLPPFDKVQLAYFNLPQQLNDTNWEMADWDDAMLEEADEEARRIIRLIWKEVFWPANPPPDFAEDLAAICLDNTLSGSGPALLAEDQGGQA
jgi:RecB family exonuclease